MNVQPAKIERVEETHLEITWSDGQRRRYTFGELRGACPCATCRQKRAAPPPAASELTVLSPAEAKPLRLERMKPTGNYAYSIAFSDGHDTGIYTFELLRDLGVEVSPRA